MREENNSSNDKGSITLTMSVLVMVCSLSLRAFCKSMHTNGHANISKLVLCFSLKNGASVHHGLHHS